MTPTRLTTEDINCIIEAELVRWPLARENFMLLREASRKPLRLGSLEGGAQFNPARIRSTGAAVDSRSIESRPCFLCAHNRPAQQHAIPWMDGWELLVNPYPILPVHFTVASTAHRPQDAVPAEMAAMAEAVPDLVFFFNGAHAGASAPDHMHVQAVLKSELPLIRLIEKYHPVGKAAAVSSEQFGTELPFHFISAVISPDTNGMRTLARICTSFGIASDGQKDPGLVNAYFWMDASGLLRAAIVPRKAHRPSCYSTEPGRGMTVSPGAIDMAGLLILPRHDDFDRIDEEKARAIYSEVAFADSLPDEIKRHFGL